MASRWRFSPTLLISRFIQSLRTDSVWKKSFGLEFSAVSQIGFLTHAVFSVFEWLPAVFSTSMRFFTQERGGVGLLPRDLRVSVRKPFDSESTRMQEMTRAWMTFGLQHFCFLLLWVFFQQIFCKLLTWANERSCSAAETPSVLEIRRKQTLNTNLFKALIHL